MFWKNVMYSLSLTASMRLLLSASLNGYLPIFRVSPPLADTSTYCLVNKGTCICVKTCLGCVIVECLRILLVHCAACCGTQFIDLMLMLLVKRIGVHVCVCVCVSCLESADCCCSLSVWDVDSTTAVQLPQQPHICCRSLSFQAEQAGLLHSFIAVLYK